MHGRFVLDWHSLKAAETALKPHIAGRHPGLWRVCLGHDRRTLGDSCCWSRLGGHDVTGPTETPFICQPVLNACGAGCIGVILTLPCLCAVGITDWCCEEALLPRAG
ncbi:hypothetical protein NDU88_007494 [Pleurodeles waltl]|uniref:Uncharacterized protein n=1 Tax=Pleurodeles waltl TaxID=8319 RepID=A0AAV7RT31_PLEWA|nr:hypothetical protein NDU88_007494 [Pleurodeles waltl]